MGRARRLATLVGLVLLVAACSSPGEVAEEPRGVAAEAAIVRLLDDFVVDPAPSRAAELAEAIAAGGWEGWAPYLVDLYPFFVDIDAAAAIAGALASLSGIETPADRVEARVTFGSWMLSTGIEPPRHYSGWKARLYAHLDPAFEPLLAQIEDPLLAVRLQWGGVVVGGIPELNEPAVFSVEEAGYLTDEELVFGAVIGGDARAYPLRIMDFHELANDVLAGVPVVLADCTLCRSGTLFRRTVDGQVLEFRTSGLLHNSNKVMVDLQTGTLWEQLTGRALAGPLQGVQLEPLFLTTTTWGRWREEQPRTDVLELPSGEVPAGVTGGFSYLPGEAYAGYYASQSVWFPIFEAPDVFEPKTEVAGVTLGGASLAVSLTDLEARGPIALTVGGVPVVVVPTGGGARLYEGDPGDGDLGVAEAGETALVLVDGTALPRLQSSQAFWFAWWGAHPETAWWPSG